MSRNRCVNMMNMFLLSLSSSQIVHIPRQQPFSIQCRLRRRLPNEHVQMVYEIYMRLWKRLDQAKIHYHMFHLNFGATFLFTSGYNYCWQLLICSWDLSCFPFMLNGQLAAPKLLHNYIDPIFLTILKFLINALQSV